MGYELIGSGTPLGMVGDPDVNNRKSPGDRANTGERYGEWRNLEVAEGALPLKVTTLKETGTSLYRIDLLKLDGTATH